MTFGDFARNYLNPFFVCYRLGLLTGGFAGLLIVFFSDAHPIAKVLFGALGIWLSWIGVKPWGTGRGLSIDQLDRMAKRANDR